MNIKDLVVIKRYLEPEEQIQGSCRKSVDNDLIKARKAIDELLIHISRIASESNKSILIPITL